MAKGLLYTKRLFRQKVYRDLFPCPLVVTNWDPFQSEVYIVRTSDRVKHPISTLAETLICFSNSVSFLTPTFGPGLGHQHHGLVLHPFIITVIFTPLSYFPIKVS